jgi:hypothetical protein
MITFIICFLLWWALGIIGSLIFTAVQDEYINNDDINNDDIIVATFTGAFFGLALFVFSIVIALLVYFDVAKRASAIVEIIFRRR